MYLRKSREEAKAKMKRLNLVLSVTALICAMMFSGCSKKDLFVNKDDVYKVTAVEQKDLENETYYVKEGAYFYLPYKAKENNKIISLTKDFDMIPSAYSTSIIAIPSVKSEIDSQELKRYKYIGYSFGMYGGTYNSDGYISFPQSNLVKDSAAYNLFYTAKSNEIRLVSINGTPVTESMVSDYGVVTNLEENGVYQIAYYVGSAYKEANLTADNIMLEYLESYTTDPATDTKNGYMSISLPQGIPSGYYSIDDGLFKYYDYEKGTGDDASCDMNTVSQVSEVEN